MTNQEDSEPQIVSPTDRDQVNISIGEYALDKRFAVTSQISPVAAVDNSLMFSRTQRTSFNPAESSVDELKNLVEARKMRLHRETEVRKLHNRI